MDLSPYTVREDEEDGYAVHVLEDSLARSQAWIVPQLGLNLYRFSIEREEESIAVIDPPSRLDDLVEQPNWFGIPILFPFVGRLPGGRMTFRERTYEMPVNATGNAIHGFVNTRPWQIVATTAKPEVGAVLVARFESQAFPELAAYYPSAFRLEMILCLKAWTLTIEARADNVGGEPLPVGYGLHPYLRAPLHRAQGGAAAAPGSAAGGCIASLPVSRGWELDNKVPTGRLLPLDEDLSAGFALEGRTFDNIFTGVLLERGASRAMLSDPRARLAAVVEADAQFKNWVIYTPPRPAVCFEPWTSLPNAAYLQERGVDSGLIVLEPGEWRSWTVRIALLADRRSWAVC